MDHHDLVELVHLLYLVLEDHLLYLEVLVLHDPEVLEDHVLPVELVDLVLLVAQVVLFLVVRLDHVLLAVQVVLFLVVRVDHVLLVVQAVLLRVALHHLFLEAVVVLYPVDEDRHFLEAMVVLYLEVWQVVYLRMFLVLPEAEVVLCLVVLDLRLLLLLQGVKVVLDQVA